MRKVLLAVSIIGLFVVAPIFGVVALALTLVAFIPAGVSFVLRLLAEGSDSVGGIILTGSDVASSAGEQVCEKRTDLQHSYELTSTELSEKLRINKEKTAALKAELHTKREAAVA